MITKRVGVRLAALAAGMSLFAAQSFAEEGMWTFDNFPSAKVKASYGAGPDQAWLDKVRLGSVRLSGCSASLVSPDGLVLTNHHCVEGCLSRLSEPGKDLVETGFVVADRGLEKQCPGQSADILLEITDVSARIFDALKGLEGAAFAQKRTAEIAAIEKACSGGDAALICQIVSLYQGGQYKLYKYRRYSDVRIAWAPEKAAGAFGGDPDNFNFPRYCLDGAFLRLYENGQPAKTPNHLTWRSSAPAEGDLVYVSGNPGRTSRAFTLDQLATQRDLVLPWQLFTLSERRGRLLAYAAQGAEQSRIAINAISGVENSFKGISGRLRALQDPEFFAIKQREQADFLSKINANPAVKAEVGDAFGEIARAEQTYRAILYPLSYAETGAGGGSSLFGYARTLVRGAAERTKPDSDRLPEFSDARLKGVEARLNQPQRIETELERQNLEFWLVKMREYVTVDDPLVRKVLGKESPEDLAKRLALSSKLGDPAVRKALWDGGQAAIEASNDPMIVFARGFDADARALRKKFETEVAAPRDRATKRLADARFKLYGDQIYPDATFTLRLSFGKVAGWTEPNGRLVPAFTRYGGLYERATGSDPFKLAPRFETAKAKLDPATVFNFSSTNDIIGGNSGSPVLDKDGQVIGAAFDGNIHSLGGEYAYDGRFNRTVSVSTAAIEEALVDVYGLQRLVDELKGPAAKPGKGKGKAKAKTKSN